MANKIIYHLHFSALSLTAWVYYSQLNVWYSDANGREVKSSKTTEKEDDEEEEVMWLHDVNSKICAGYSINMKNQKLSSVGDSCSIHDSHAGNDRYSLIFVGACLPYGALTI